MHGLGGKLTRRDTHESTFLSLVLSYLLLNYYERYERYNAYGEPNDGYRYIAILL